MNFEAVEKLEASLQSDVERPSADLRRQRLLRLLDELPKIAGNARRGAQSFPHPFPARMPLNVAQSIAAALCSDGDVLLDPMAGSGTSLKVAADLRCTAIGYDMDPLAVHLARTLAAPPCASNLRHAAMRALMAARDLQLKTNLKDYLYGLDAEDQKFVGYWFPEDVAHTLFCLATSVEEFSTADTRSALITLFSSTIIARSAGASFALDLARSRPHRDLSKPIRDPLGTWMRKLQELERFCETTVSDRGGVRAECGDARSLPMAESQVDVVMTSPPYLNAIDYIRTSKFSLVFLGHSIADLRVIRRDSIGTEVGLSEGDGRSQFEAAILKSIRDNRRRGMVRRYIADLTHTLQEAYRVLRPGGVAVFAVGPSMISRSKYDGGIILGELASHVGYSVIGMARRDLSSSNRSLPPPKRNSRSEAIHRRMACELYVGLQRPSA